MGCDSSSEVSQDEKKNPTLAVVEENAKGKQDDKKNTLKLLLLGDADVGKSSLMFRFVEGKSPGAMMTTVGIDFKWTNVVVKDTTYRVQIWDTAGQEKFRTIARSYYRNVKGYILVFDVTDRDSFEHIEYWLEELTNQGNPGTYKILVGNKADKEQERKVSTKEAKNFAKTHGATFMETSALVGTNVNEMFIQIVTAYAQSVVAS